MGEECLIVGFVRGSHGVSGELKVESASGEYGHIAALKEVALRRGSKTESRKVESVRIGNGALFMKLAGIDSPEDARARAGWEIVVPREYAAPLKENEWYIEDLKHCSLMWNGKGSAAEAAPACKVGTITDVLEGGGGYLLEVSLSEDCNVLADNIKKTAAGRPRTVFVPFNLDHVGGIDVKNKTIELMHLWILE